MNLAQAKTNNRIRRHVRIRSQMSGTVAMPRLSVYKSNRYLHAQIIDDVRGTTLVSGTTKGLKGTKTATATALGTDLAQRAKAAGVDRIVFDRGGFRYAGRIATLAQAAREAGLTF